MRSTGRFFKRTGAGGGGDDDGMRDMSNGWGAEVGSWRSTVRTGGYHSPRAHGGASGAVSSFRSSNFRDVENSREKIGRNASEPTHFDEEEDGVRPNGEMVDCAIGSTMENRMGRSVGGGRSSRQIEVTSYRDELGHGLVKDRVTSGSKYLIQRDAACGRNVFKTLDDRAAAVLRKSMQALESGHSLVSVSLRSAGPELRSRWPRDNFDQGCFVSFRCGQLNESASGATHSTAVRDLTENRSNDAEVFWKAESTQKLGGVIGDRRLSVEGNERFSEDNSVEFKKEESLSHRRAYPNKCQRNADVEWNPTDFILDDEREGKMPRRSCRWPRMSAKPPGPQRKPTNLRIASKRREEVNFNFAQSCIIHKNHECNHMETTKIEYEACPIHRELSEPANKWEETTKNEHEPCPLHRELGELANKWEAKTECPHKGPEFDSRHVGTYDCGSHEISAFAQGLLCSSQGATIASSSGTDSSHCDDVLESQNTHDIPGKPQKISALRALLTSSNGCENLVSRENDNAEGAEMNQKLLSEKNKLAKLNLCTGDVRREHLQDYPRPSDLERAAEGVGCINSRPSTPSKTHKARSASAKSYSETRSEKLLEGDGSFLSESESLSLLPGTTGTRSTSREPVRPPPHCESLVVTRKICPMILSSPRRLMMHARKRNHCGMGRLTAQSKYLIEPLGVAETEGQIEIKEQGVSLAAQKTGIAVTVNISIIASEKKQASNQVKSTGTNHPRKTAESKGTQTSVSTEMVENSEITQTIIFTEMVQNSVKSGSQFLAKSTRTHLPTEELVSPRTQPFDKVANHKPSVSERSRMPKNKPKSEEDDSSDTRTDFTSDSPPSSEKRGSAGLRLWPRVIPELDDWILEAISKLLGTEESLVHSVSEDTSVKVSPKGTSIGVNTSNQGKYATLLRAPSVGGCTSLPSYPVPYACKLLETQIKRLAELDSRISTAQSVNDLFQILDGISCIQRPTPENREKTA